MSSSERSERPGDSFPEPRGLRHVPFHGSLASPPMLGDGRGLCFAGADGRSYLACAVTASPPLTVGRPQVLFPISLETRAVLPSRDGQKFLVIVASGERPMALTLVQNWSAQPEKP